MSGIRGASSTDTGAVGRAANKSETPETVKTAEPAAPEQHAALAESGLEEKPAWLGAEPNTCGLTQGAALPAGGGLLGFLGAASSTSDVDMAAPTPSAGALQTSKGWAELKPEDKTLLSQMLGSPEPLARQQRAVLQQEVGSEEWGKMTPTQQKDALEAKLKPFKTLRGMQSSRAWAVLDLGQKNRLIAALTDPGKDRTADVLSRMVATKGYALRNDQEQAALLLQQLRLPAKAKTPPTPDPGPAAASKRLAAQPAAYDMDARTRQRFDLLLAGKTNPYAREARIELERRSHDPVYAIMTRTEQTEYLVEIASGKTVAPYLVSSLPVTERAPAEHRLSPPTLRPAFKFKGATQDANETTLRLHGRDIPIYSARGTPVPLQETPEEVARALATIPASALRQVKQVVINPVRNPGDAYWAKTFNQKNFRAAMTAADGSVNIFPAGSKQRSPNVVAGTLCHEAGHLLAYESFGKDVGGPGWQRYQQAAERDGLAPSGYGTGNINEDFAETLQLYLTHRGAPDFEELRSLYPARFAVVEDVLNNRIREPAPAPTPARTPATRPGSQR